MTDCSRGGDGSSSSGGGCCCQPQDVTDLINSLIDRISNLELQVGSLPDTVPNIEFTNCSGTSIANNAQLVECGDLENLRQQITSMQGQQITDCSGNLIEMVPTCEQMAGANAAIEVNQQNISTLADAVTPLSATIDSLVVTIEAMQNAPQWTILESIVEGLQSTLDNLQTQLDSVSEIANNAASGVENLENENASDNTSTLIEDLQDSFDALQTSQSQQGNQITTMNASITSLDTRVTALEVFHP